MAAMTELDMLDRRRELVELSASLQRATLSRRLAAVEARPGRTLLDMFLQLASQPLARRMAPVAAALVWRLVRRRRAIHP